MSKDATSASPAYVTPPTHSSTSHADSLAASNADSPAPAPSPASAVDKGKGKRTATDAELEDHDVEHPVDEEEDDDDDDDDEEEEEDDEEDDDEEFEEIDPSVIRSRRTRGVKVDYTSPEALAKAGLKAGDDDDDE
ncbi:hypothetical protein M0805_005717 [Coniferiporia weirii]|nr:hypothetical protein M0805_005717 [Coniferiporia weirii]